MRLPCWLKGGHCDHNTGVWAKAAVALSPFCRTPSIETVHVRRCCRCQRPTADVFDHFWGRILL